jgi:hypothetical protein
LAEAIAKVVMDLLFGHARSDHIVAHDHADLGETGAGAGGTTGSGSVEEGPGGEHEGLIGGVERGLGEGHHKQVVDVSADDARAGVALGRGKTWGVGTVCAARVLGTHVDRSNGRGGTVHGATRNDQSQEGYGQVATGDAHGGTVQERASVNKKR